MIDEPSRATCNPAPKRTIARYIECLCEPLEFDNALFELGAAVRDGYPTVQTTLVGSGRLRTSMLQDDSGTDVAGPDGFGWFDDDLG